MSDESDLDPTFIVVRCEKCDAKLRVRSTLAGTVGTCPKCQSALLIPKLPDYGAEESDSPFEDHEEEDDHLSYRLATPLEFESEDEEPAPLPRVLNPPAPEHGFLDELGKVRQVAISKPPEWTFFSGVFEFPWYDEVWPRWIWLVIGGISISIIPVLMVSVLESSSGYAGVAVAFFAMPQIWLSIWTGSHAACCGVQVFEDTAAGNDHVSGWPDPNWRDWMLPFMHQGYVAILVLALAYGAGSVIGLSGTNLMAAMIASLFFLYPLCWLSVLEANSILTLFSPTVMRTLITKPVSWLTYYFLSGLIAATWIGVLWGACRISLYLGMILNGFLFATCVLIYYRLLGRLAWSISHFHRRKRKSVSNQPEVLAR